MRALIVGCGYVGLALGAELVRQGHAVFGLRRSDRCDAELIAAGIQPVKADLTVPTTLPPLGRGYDWVVHCVSASGGVVQEYEQVYFHGTHHLISWLSAAPPVKFLYTSSTGVYGELDGSTVDETSPASPESATGQILVRTEQLLLDGAGERGFPVVVLRVAGIYGPGRAYWLDQIRAGTARIEGAGDRLMNMIHRDDVVGAIQAGLERGRPGQIYNAVDDEPVLQGSLLEWLSARLNLPCPEASSAEKGAFKKRGLTNKRVSNRRLRGELGYSFKFATFREGYASVLTDDP